MTITEDAAWIRTQLHDAETALNTLLTEMHSDAYTRLVARRHINPTTRPLAKALWDRLALHGEHLEQIYEDAF